jgi:hypothetical protein
MEASQNAELISLGIAENGPCLLARSNVYPTGTECDQTVHLFVEPLIDGADVHVQAILHGLRLRNPHKDEGWRTRMLTDRVDCRTFLSDLDLIPPILKRLISEHRSPELGETSRLLTSITSSVNLLTIGLSPSNGPSDAGLGSSLTPEALSADEPSYSIAP